MRGQKSQANLLLTLSHRSQATIKRYECSAVNKQSRYLGQMSVFVLPILLKAVSMDSLEEDTPTIQPVAPVVHFPD